MEQYRSGFCADMWKQKTDRYSTSHSIILLRMYRTSTFQYQKCFKIKYCSKSARKLVCCVAQFIFLAQYCGITVIANILPGFFLSVYHFSVYPPEQAAGPVQKMQIFRSFFYQCITVYPPELAACPVKNANVQVFLGHFPPRSLSFFSFPEIPTIPLLYRVMFPYTMPEAISLDFSFPQNLEPIWAGSLANRNV